MPMFSYDPIHESSSLGNGRVSYEGLKCSTSVRDNNCLTPTALFKLMVDLQISSVRKQCFNLKHTLKIYHQYRNSWS